MKRILFFVLLLTIGVTACAAEPVPPTALSSPIETSAPTTVPPNPTDVPAPTAAPTDSPLPLPTNTTAATAEPSPTVAPTEPAAPTAAATESPAAASPTAGTEPTAAVAVVGDIAHGKTLFVTNKCDSCHDVSNPFPGGEYGPNLGNISTEALNVIALPEYMGTATNAVEYIRESVWYPNTYIVPGPNYLDSPGVSNMTQDFIDTVSEQDLNDLIAYLLSLDAQ